MVTREAFRLTALLGASLVTTGETAWAAPPATEATEEDPYYRMVTIPIPKGLVLEAGALELLPGRKLAASSRHGDIYVIEGAFEATPARPVFKPFASGLHEVLGLAARDGWLYAVQRGEVSRLRDADGDGRADVFETVTDAWG